MTKVRVAIEVDLTQVNKTWFSLRKKDNTPHYVIGFFQRDGKAIIKAIPDKNPDTIKAAVLGSTDEGCILYCEENILPDSLKLLYEIHELKVSNGQYTNGDIHVNNVKNMWKDLKRQLKRTHIRVSQKHLQGYCDEVAWRISHRNLSPSEKFDLLLTNSCLVKPREKSTAKNVVK